MDDTCARCGRPRYPDSFRFCGHCDLSRPLAIEVIKSPQDYADDAQPVGTDRMSVREMLIWGAVALGVFLLWGWGCGEVMPR